VLSILYRAMNNERHRLSLSLVLISEVTFEGGSLAKGFGRLSIGAAVYYNYTVVTK